MLFFAHSLSFSFFKSVPYPLIHTIVPCSIVLQCIALQLHPTAFLLSHPLLTALCSMFPEYYEIIKNPRDLSTIKEQLNKYETVEECLADLRLVWANCRLFNSEGSDIADTADALGAELEEMVEVRIVLYVRACAYLGCKDRCRMTCDYSLPSLRCNMLLVFLE